MEGPWRRRLAVALLPPPPHQPLVCSSGTVAGPSSALNRNLTPKQQKHDHCDNLKSHDRRYQSRSKTGRPLPLPQHWPQPLPSIQKEPARQQNRPSTPPASATATATHPMLPAPQQNRPSTPPASATATATHPKEEQLHKMKMMR